MEAPSHASFHSASIGEMADPTTRDDSKPEVSGQRSLSVPISKADSQSGCSSGAPMRLSASPSITDPSPHGAGFDGRDSKKAKAFACSTCNKLFSRSEHLLRHVRRVLLTSWMLVARGSTDTDGYHLCRNLAPVSVVPLDPLCVIVIHVRIFQTTAAGLTAVVSVGTRSKEGKETEPVFRFMPNRDLINHPDELPVFCSDVLSRHIALHQQPAPDPNGTSQQDLPKRPRLHRACNACSAAKARW
jgi:hypothetical protein